MSPPQTAAAAWTPLGLIGCCRPRPGVQLCCLLCRGKQPCCRACPGGRPRCPLPQHASQRLCPH
eukprot:scaffold124555_cov21-Tisochrysis_lutea.AAC.1